MIAKIKIEELVSLKTNIYVGQKINGITVGSYLFGPMHFNPSEGYEEILLQNFEDNLGNRYRLEDIGIAPIALNIPVVSWIKQ